MKWTDNIQLYQTVSLTVILSIGVILYDLDIEWYEIITVFSTVFIAELFFKKIQSGEWKLPYSGINAGFGVSFFLHTQQLWIYIFAGLLAIASKYIFTLKNDRHFLNPSNFGVCLCLVLFPNIAWTNPLQWGQFSSGVAYAAALVLMCGLGIFVLRGVGKILAKNLFPYVGAFILTHFLLYMTITKEVGTDAMILFFNGSFVTFIFFMMTDPKTLPIKAISRILYAITMGGGYYLLWFFINENYALLFSLFFMTLCLPLIWRLETKQVYIRNREVNLSLFFLLSLLGIVVIGLLIQVYLNGMIDLLFYNRCTRLVCI